MKIKMNKILLATTSIIVGSSFVQNDVSAGWNINKPDSNDGSKFYYKSPNECVVLPDNYGGFCAYDIASYGVYSHLYQSLNALVGNPTEKNIIELTKAYENIYKYKFTDNNVEGALAVFPKVVEVQKAVDMYVKQDKPNAVIGNINDTPDGYDLYNTMKLIDELRAYGTSSNETYRLGYDAYARVYVEVQFKKLQETFYKHWNHAESYYSTSNENQLRAKRKLIENTDFVNNQQVLLDLKKTVAKLTAAAEKLSVRSTKPYKMQIGDVEGLDNEFWALFIQVGEVMIKDAEYINKAIDYLISVGNLYNEALIGARLVEVEKKALLLKKGASVNLKSHTIAQKMSEYLMGISILHAKVVEIEKGASIKEFSVLSPIEKQFNSLKVPTFDNASFVKRLGNEREALGARILKIRNSIINEKTEMVAVLESKPVGSVTAMEFANAKKEVSKLENGTVRDTLFERLDALYFKMKENNKDVFAESLYKNIMNLEDAETVNDMMAKVQKYDGENLTPSKKAEFERVIIDKIEEIYGSAKAAVDKAERTKDLMDFNSASILVNKLSENYVSKTGIKKSDLKLRVEKLSDEIVAFYNQQELEKLIARANVETNLARKIISYSNIMDNIQLSYSKGLISSSGKASLENKVLTIKTDIKNQINVKFSALNDLLGEDGFAKYYNDMAILVSTIPNKTNVEDVKIEVATKFQNISIQAKKLGVVKNYTIEKEKAVSSGNLTKVYSLVVEMESSRDSNLASLIVDLKSAEKKMQSDVLVLAHKVKEESRKKDIEQLAIIISQLPYEDLVVFRDIGNGMSSMTVKEIKMVLLDSINNKTINDKVGYAKALLETVSKETTFNNVQIAYNYIITLPNVGKAVPIYEEINVYVDKYNKAVESYVESAEKLKTAESIKTANDKLKYALNPEFKKLMKARIDKIK